VARQYSLHFMLEKPQIKSGDLWCPQAGELERQLRDFVG
jgi:hypothetical protein